MYDNHRDSFGRRYRSEDDRPRHGQYWREQTWPTDRNRNDADDDRTEWRAYRPRYDTSGRDEGYYRGRSAQDEQLHHDHGDRQYGYDRYGDRGQQQRYFTGQQSSWAVPEQRPYGTGSYGAASGGYGSLQGFGRDYREHGYGGASSASYRAYGDRDDDRGFFEKAGDEIASWFGDEGAARRREADHRGRGPKDYIRSDDRIRDDVNDRLTDDWRVDASNIAVAVDKGEVTLNGTVTARDAKRRAEDIVEDVSGVKHVQNNLRVAETKASASGVFGDDSWALNPRSAAEGGTLKDTTPAKH